MTDKDIRKLSRTELLELLIDQTKENEALTERIEEQVTQINELKKRLEDRAILIENAGSIAEASLRLNEVFEAAQAAADEYVENVRAQFEHQKEYALTAEAETQRKVDEMIKESEQRCALLESATARKCEEMTAKAKKESQEYWDQVSAKLGEYMKQRADLRELLSSNHRTV